MPPITYTHENGVATITLNNPPQNRMSAAVAEGLTAAIQDLAERTDTRVLLLKAEGPDFSYGADIQSWAGQPAKDFSESIAGGVMMTKVFQDFPFPIIVAVQGYCGGGGFEMALRGDIIIAADNAEFCHSEASIAVFTLLGGVQRVADRVGRTKAMQWALTSERVNAQTALDTGLVNEVVPAADLHTRAQEWVDRLKDSATLSHVAHKKLLRAWSDGGVEAADALMAEMAGDILVSEDAQACLPEAIKAVEDGRARPQFIFKGK